MTLDLTAIPIGCDPSAPTTSLVRTCQGCGAPAPRVFCESCTRALVTEGIARQNAERVERDLRAIDANLASIPTKAQFASLAEPWEHQPRRLKRPEALAEAREAAAAGATNVVLVGSSGAGKTSLGCAIFRALLEAARASGDPQRLAFGARALFARARSLAKARAEHPLGEGEAPLVERAKDASLLLLDELGAEVARNTAIAEVLDERQSEERPTIITTGFGKTVLTEKYGDGIARRIFEKGITRIIWCEPKPARPPSEARS